MKVKCILCDKIENIDSYTLTAKKLRKKRIFSYMCEDCKDRINKRTEERKSTGNFRVYREQKKDPYL